MASIHNIDDYKTPENGCRVVVVCLECEGATFYIADDTYICAGCHNEFYHDEVENA